MLALRIINFKCKVTHSHINLFGNVYATKRIVSVTSTLAFIRIRMLSITLYGFKIITASQ